MVRWVDVITGLQIKWLNLPHTGFKALRAGRNTKGFDQPFDRLTVLSEVEGLTTLSQVEEQI
jgi:hypothetical protein